MKKGILGFVAVLLIIAIFGVIAISGLNLGKFKIPSAADGIRLGLDLSGGAQITFQADTDGKGNPSKNEMEVAQTVLRTRLDSAGYTEGSVQISGDDRLMVEIPNVKDPNEASALLGKTAVLEFLDADGNVVLTGSEVKKAEHSYSPTTETGPNEHHVILTLTKEGRQKFVDATKAAASKSAEGKNYIQICLDGEVQSAPFVDAKYASTGINSESASITVGSEKAEETSKELANIINAGRLPFDLKEVELRSVGPTLGEKALETSLYAGFIGLILVMIFMIAIYRLPGVVASVSLAFYTFLVIIVLSLFKVNLSLPGIAGIILSIGMAVDANVIIYERIKEELRNQKTLKASIDSGFKRAFTSIFDSNITTLIAAIVLYFFGKGSIIGFAITLGIGVVLSMFTVLVVSRFLLYRLVDMKVKSLKAYGA